MSKLLENCPICNGKMEKGYVNSGLAGFFWTKTKKDRYLPWDVETLVGSNISSWTGGVVEGCMCRNCKIVLFYGEKINPKKDKFKKSLEEYKKLLDTYMFIHGSGSERLVANKLKTLMKQGYSQEEAIHKLVVKEGLENE